MVKKIKIDLVEGNGMQIWDQQPGEHAAAYSYFVRYLYSARYMDERNIKELALECGKSDQTLYEYSNKFHWRERVSAYDAKFQETRQKDWEAIKSHTEEKIARQAIRLLDRFSEDVTDMLNGEAIATAEAVAASIKASEGLPDTVEVVIKADVSGWKDIANAFATLAKEARIGVGLPTNITQSKGHIEHTHTFEELVKRQREEVPELDSGLAEDADE